MGGISKSQFLSSLDTRHSIMFAHIFDMAVHSERCYGAVYGDFLSENSIALLNERKRFLPAEPMLFGGFQGAERQMVAFIPEYEEADFPISALKITSSMLGGLSHRDFLGSVLSLGIKREKCGDIIINEDYAYILLSRDISSYALNSLTKVGRIGVKTEIVPLSDLSVPQKCFKPITGTVSSLRLDAIVSLFSGKGRSKAAELVSGGLVFVNGLCVQKSDFRLSDGDVISIRGKGTATVTLGGTSKKDRIFVTLNSWV